MRSNFLNPHYDKSINKKFREKRFNFFLKQLKKLDADQTINILDIGGTEIYWERMNFTSNKNIHITLLNLEEFPVKHDNFTSVKGDACNLDSYSDKQFDIVYSNSVIEHLFTFEKQKEMADEIRRVAKNYFVQTPNYYFPIEPHWIFPFFQFLPFNVRVFLTKNFSIGAYRKSDTWEAAKLRVREVKLLTEKEMKRLFPGGKVYRERFFGLIKSVILYDFPES